MPFDETAAFLADFGSTVSFGMLTAKGILDAPGRDLGLAGVSVTATDWALTFATTDLPGLQEGSWLTVDGKGFTVRQIEAIDDGVFRRAMLKANG